MRHTGVDPKNPGENRIALVISPYVKNSIVYAGHSFIATNDHEQRVGTVARQMAHAMGLRQANVLESGSEIIRTLPDDDSWYNCQGQSSCIQARNDYLVRSGNVYSLMGFGHGLAEMNLLYKSFFGWVDLNTDVPLVNTTGRYRIYAFDHGEKSNGPIGLRLQSGNGKYTYWLEYRTTGSHAENARQGVLLNLEGYGEYEKDPHYWKTTSYLLDMTPESRNATQQNWWGDDYKDSALTLGQDFEDKWGGFKIRPHRVGGDANSANAWIEVDVVNKADGLVAPGGNVGTSTATPALNYSTATPATKQGTATPASKYIEGFGQVLTRPDPIIRPPATLHEVAVIYLKEQGKKPQFNISTLHERIVHQVDDLIRSNSFGKEGFGHVGKFGWYDIDSTQWNAVLQSNSWTTLDPVVQAKRNGVLDLHNYDYVLNIWDDVQQVIAPRGTAVPHKKDITIDGTTYRKKSEMAKYLKPYDLNDHCFYKEQIYNNLDRCYTNPVGENLKVFDGVVFHEFLHTKRLAHHSSGKFCDNVLLGQCDKNHYNMFDALSSARFYGNSLNAHDKHRIKWLTDDDVLSLQPNTGRHDITLSHLNNHDNGKKAVKITYKTLIGSNIWLEFRQPTRLDYGLFNKVFDKATNGSMALT